MKGERDWERGGAKRKREREREIQRIKGLFQ